MRQMRDKETQKVNALLSVHQSVGKPDAGLGVLENKARTENTGVGGSGTRCSLPW